MRRGLAIPIRTDETIALIARVKLDATMPRPGAQATGEVETEAPQEV